MPAFLRSSLLVASLFCALAFAQARTPAFDTLAAGIEKARTEQVDALAPANFQAAVAAYQEALKDAEKNRNPDRIAKQLAAGTASLNAANTAAAIARETLKSAIATRADALMANAPKFAPEQWQKASARFNEASAALEKKDAANAQRRAAESEVLLREAELSAVKGGILNEARALIAQADAAKVEKFAPRTLQAAKRLLAQAEQEIITNRYDTTLPKNLAAQSSYEARHAVYLAQLIDSTQQKKGEQAGLEELILSWEEPLRRVATEMDLTSRFDAGVQPALKDMLAAAQQRREQLNRLQQELDDRNEQIAGLNAEVARLESRLGGVSEERIALQRRVDAQERMRASVARIEASFTSNEARVLRQGDDVILSLTGIAFPSGRSTLDVSSAPLMAKVRDALGQFPDTSIVVEGHTDANGSDSTNLILSQDRADAVKKYLVDNFGVNPEKISSIGYGEARPVATNETAEGRARNRRIDLILHVGAAR